MQLHHFLTPKGLALRLASRRRYGVAAPLSREILHVDPHDIIGERNTPHAIATHARFGQTRGLVADGDWDQGLTYFSLPQSGLYRSCVMRWQEGRPWSETPAYQSYQSKIEAGTPHHDAPTMAALDARYAQLDQIFAAISSEGCMSEAYEDLITITLNHKGEVFWGPNGRHRVCIALVLGFDKMPARVGMIHADALGQFQKMRSHRRARMRNVLGFYG